MTGDSEKSDCVMEPRYRSEGRPSLPRRRVATKTLSHENGDFEMELSLAIKESLKYAKEKEGQLKSVDKTSPLLNCVKSDESFSRMAGKMLTFATSSDQGQGTEETQQLKELLLIHIELIQHQQELMTTKDKEIRLLRNEKDALQCRLQRAEKRMVQMKQKEDFLEAQIAKDIATATEVTAHARPSEKNKVLSKPEQTPSRKRKRAQKSMAKRLTKLKKRHTSGVNRTSESVTSEEIEDSDAENDESSDNGDDDDNAGNEEASGVDDEHSGDDSDESEDMMDEDKENKNGDNVTADENKDPHPEPVLRTDCLYHVSCCVEALPQELVEVQDEKEVDIGDRVEIPGWRTNVLTNRYQLEGTENITDEAYQKRHQKHEVEEKRRKRWDIQRMRDQQAFEKLRGKEEVVVCAADNEETLKTFLPNMDKVTHIEISDSVPVMAFGQAVLHIEPSEFELPWDTGPSSSFTRKSHGGRGRQK